MAAGFLGATARPNTSNGQKVVVRKWGLPKLCKNDYKISSLGR